MTRESSTKECKIADLQPEFHRAIKQVLQSGEQVHICCEHRNEYKRTFRSSEFIYEAYAVTQDHLIVARSYSNIDNKHYVGGASLKL